MQFISKVNIFKNVTQSGWKSGFTLHKPGGGHGSQESQVQLVPKSEQRQASVVEVVVVV